MSPITHYLTGWVFANCARLDTRERTLVTLAAVAPDLDGLGIIAELLTRNSAHPWLWFTQYHHSLHNLFFALVVGAVSFLWAKQKWKTAAMAFASFHLHLLEDLAGSRSRDNSQWPIPYLAPLSPVQLSWGGQWALNAWPNFVITTALVLVSLWLTWRTGHSPIEMFSLNADRVLVKALRQRFPPRAGALTS